MFGIEVECPCCGARQTKDESRFQRSGRLLGPVYPGRRPASVALRRALPWAGMNDAFGVQRTHRRSCRASE
jgi:hypothetical protein